MDVEKLTELWLTFCINNNTDIEPTVDTLIKMESTTLKVDYKLHDSTRKNVHAKQEQNTVEKHFAANEAVYPLTLKLSLFWRIDEEYDR